MGISHEWFNFFIDLIRNGELRRGATILDLGASELFCASDPGRLNDFLEYFNAEPYGEDELRRMADRAFAGELFRRAGFQYAAIDYADFPGVIRLDLNSGRLPWRHRRRYDFIANSGTSEHILNQYNVFKVIHDAAAPGAIMYHGVPAWGDYEHGIIGYTPKFFWSLATANNYEILKFWGWSDGVVAPLKPDFMRQISFSHAPQAERVWLHILLRKRGSHAFLGLNDPAFSAVTTKPLRN